MKRAGIFGKNFDPGMTPTMQALVDSLHDHGISLAFYHEFLSDCHPCLRLPHSFQVFSDYQELIQFKPDILFSVGGDGTLLQTITLVRDSGIPVLGINTGRMGFLSNTPTGRLNQAIDLLFRGNYSLDKRSLLRLESREGLFGDVNFGLNEFSVHGVGARSLIVVKVWVDGEFLNSYWADGLLIATPTGSTAYSLSCHGPIVSPGAGAFIINPIANHNLSVRPVVISDTSVIKVIAGGRESSYIVGLDSRTEMIGPDQELIIRKESFDFNMVKLHGEDFFSTIRQKLLWGLDVRN
jgi:NAD+ kinase